MDRQRRCLQTESHRSVCRHRTTRHPQPHRGSAHQKQHYHRGHRRPHLSPRRPARRRHRPIVPDQPAPVQRLAAGIRPGECPPRPLGQQEEKRLRRADRKRRRTPPHDHRRHPRGRARVQPANPVPAGAGRRRSSLLAPNPTPTPRHTAPHSRHRGSLWLFPVDRRICR